MGCLIEFQVVSAFHAHTSQLLRSGLRTAERARGFPALRHIDRPGRLQENRRSILQLDISECRILHFKGLRVPESELVVLYGQL